MKTQTQLEPTWKLLEYSNLYRFLIAVFFVFLIEIQKLPEPLGSYDARLFIVATKLYLLLSVIIACFIKLRIPQYGTQITIQVILDICIINLLMYSSSGVSSGFGMLLIVAVIGGSILRGDKIATLFAAIATLAVLTQEFYIHFFQPTLRPNYTYAGFLGIACFITAWFGQILASKVKKSEAMAQQHAIDLQNLSMLHEHIVQHMQSGLAVLDAQDNLRLLNKSAENLLASGNIQTLSEIEYPTKEILIYINNWQHNNGPATIIYKTRKNIDVQLSFIHLNLGHEFRTLMFIEDIAHIRQHAQQLKTASLGRLSASIAHEIRNPLAAIRHASQLLCESNILDKENQYLADIITNHTIRLNKIITNVEQISKRQAANLERINISRWMDNFITEFIAQKQLQTTAIYKKYSSKKISIVADNSQLQQVLWNLSDNALRHSRLEDEQRTPLIEYEWDLHAETGRAYLDVIDHGGGMKEAVATQLFEPFFTTNIEGSGLGLYISRELCEANQATLVLDKNTSKGCRFRIHFAHHNKHKNLLL